MALVTTSNRKLRSGRKLPGINCGDICCDYAPGTCWHEWPMCEDRECEEDDFWRRELFGKSKEPSAELVVLDEFFFDEEESGRSLTHTYISLEECLQRKKLMQQTVLDEVDEVSVECASILLSPNNLQCIAAIPE